MCTHTHTHTNTYMHWLRTNFKTTSAFSLSTYFKIGYNFAIMKSNIYTILY